MRPITLALLGTVAAAAMAVPGAAYAQTAGSMTPSLDCPPEVSTTPGTPTPSPTLGVDPDVFGDGGGTTGGGGTGTGTGGGGTGTGGGGTGTGGGTGGTPTPTPSPTVVAGGPGTTTQYLTNPSIANMRVTTGKSDHAAGGTVHYYRASSVDGRYAQKLSTVKTYPTPSGPGVLTTVAGQKILLKDRNQVMTGLSTGITRIIDEINLSAAALGYPDPIVTAGHDTDGHSPTSLHYTGNALDLRCNSVNGLSGTQCKKWVVTLANALGSSYDVIFEDYGNNNSHVHIGYKG
jgi:hypothetical protein